MRPSVIRTPVGVAVSTVSRGRIVLYVHALQLWGAAGQSSI